MNGTVSATKRTGKDSGELFTVFVKNCPREWTHEDLFNEFSKHGAVSSAKMSIDGNFTSRGFGFVSFESSKVAQKAIKEANGKSHSKLGDHSDSETAAEQAQEDDDKKLQVTEFLSKQDRNGTMKPKCSTNLYIKNFPVKDAGEFGETDL